jgi:predicted PurR-regulated permease PerM
MEQYQYSKTTNAGMVLGTIGMVLGIISFVTAIIPCTWYLAVALAPSALILSIIGLVQANRYNGSKGMPVAGLIISSVAIIFVILWFSLFASIVSFGSKFVDEIGNIEDWSTEFEEAIDEETMRELEDVMDDLENDIDYYGVDTLEFNEEDEIENNE